MQQTISTARFISVRQNSMKYFNNEEDHGIQKKDVSCLRPGANKSHEYILAGIYGQIIK